MQQNINLFIQNALAEDIGTGDITTLATIPKNNISEAICYVKEDCTIAGIELALQICRKVDEELIVEFTCKDGDIVNSNTAIGNIKGSTHSILKLERLLLNCMQRMSAIATKTRHFVQLIAPYRVQLLDTRKTTPNFRVCEKWAVVIGGGVNHRIGLYDQILIKDNHIKAAGGIQKAIEACINYMEVHQVKVPVIVEVKNETEFKIAESFPIVDRILLDNFEPVAIIDLLSNNITHKKLEASGGINASNIVAYAKTGIHYVSLGDLTHHVSSIDISLKII